MKENKKKKMRTGKNRKRIPQGLKNKHRLEGGGGEKEGGVKAEKEFGKVRDGEEEWKGPLSGKHRWGDRPI